MAVNTIVNPELLKVARLAMKAESESVKAAAENLNEMVVLATEHIFNAKGKVVVTGLGKSGHIGKKLAATLASTGTPAFFLHPSEALHGDMGVISDGDTLLAIAFGGETQEVLEVCRYSKRLGNAIVAITGKLDSSLAKMATFLLDGSIHKEVCPLNLAPTASTAVALALGDALAVCLMHRRGFSEVDFASLHPGGSLGRKLSTVADHMHGLGQDFSKVQISSDFHSVLEAVTKRNFGIVPVVDASSCLIGAISDGDIRRKLLKNGAKTLQMTAQELMTKSPRTTPQTALAIDAFHEMEKNQITSLFVTASASDRVLVGIVRMHDLLTAKIV